MRNLAKLRIKREIRAPALLEAVKSSSSGEVQRAAAFTLTKIGDIDIDSVRAAAEVLAKVLADGSQDVQKVAAYALGKIKPPAKLAVPPLITAMDDANAGVRADAASALENYSSDESAFSLILDSFSERGSEARVALAALIVRFAEKVHPPISANMMNQFQLAQEKIKSELQISTSANKQALQTSLTALHQITAGIKPSIFIRLWNNKIAFWITAPVFIYFICFLWLRYIVLRFWPLQLFKWNEALDGREGTLPPWLLQLKIPVKYIVPIGFFHYAPRVLDAWVVEKSGEARKEFENKQTVRLRRTYVRLPVESSLRAEPIAELSAQDLHAACSEDHWYVRILGEGGVGKTTLACQFALWAISEEPSARLSPRRPMLPVLLEAGYAMQAFRDPASFRKAVLSQIQELTGTEEPASERFVQTLLRTRRVLVILDGVSEIDAAALIPTWDGLSFGDPDFPVPALIVTSRNPDLMDSGVQIDIRPMRIDSNHLLPFMNAYVSQARIKLADADLFEGCRRLAIMAGRARGITPLLAKLYAEAVVGFFKSSHPFSELPRNIPELMLAYLNELNRTRSTGAFSDSVVHAAAKRIAWACIEDTFRPGRAKKSTLLTLEHDQVPLTEDLMAYLETKLCLLETISPSKTHIQFVLDPLAEYLAAMYVVEACGSREDSWDEFLALVDKKLASHARIEEFLVAICDCIGAADAGGVPQRAVERLIACTQSSAPLAMASAAGSF